MPDAKKFPEQRSYVIGVETDCDMKGKEIAPKIGVSASEWSKWRNGHRPIPGEKRERIEKFRAQFTEGKNLASERARSAGSGDPHGEPAGIINEPGEIRYSASAGYVVGPDLIAQLAGKTHPESIDKIIALIERLDADGRVPGHIVIAEDGPIEGMIIDLDDVRKAVHAAT